MATLESQYNQEEDGNKHDPYYDVITKKEHNGRLRLHGRGVSKSIIRGKGKDKMSSYIVPMEILQSIKADLVKQLAPDITSMVVSSIQAANPGIQINAPEFNLTVGDASSAKSCQPNQQPSTATSAHDEGTMDVSAGMDD